MDKKNERIRKITDIINEEINKCNYHWKLTVSERIYNEVVLPTFLEGSAFGSELEKKFTKYLKNENRI